MRTVEEMTRQAITTGQLAAELAKPLQSSQRVLKDFGYFDSPVRKLMDDIGRDDSLRRIIFADDERSRTISAVAHAHRESELTRCALFTPGVLEQAMAASQLAQTFALPGALEGWRLSRELFAARVHADDETAYVGNADLEPSLSGLQRGDLSIGAQGRFTGHLPLHLFCPLTSSRHPSGFSRFGGEIAPSLTSSLGFKGGSRGAKKTILSGT